MSYNEEDDKESDYKQAATDAKSEDWESVVGASETKSQDSKSLEIQGSTSYRAGCVSKCSHEDKRVASCIAPNC